jgi:transcriptional regulator with XRE-family HTH domain
VDRGPGAGGAAAGRGVSGERGGATPSGFGGLLRGHRRAAGLTQEALAERAGLSVRGLQHLEAGDAVPARATLGALLDALRALGLPPDERARLEAAARRPARDRRPYPSRSRSPPSSAGSESWPRRGTCCPGRAS